MELLSLKIGSKILLESGTVALVVGETEDDRWIRVVYLTVPGDPELEGTEDLCTSEEILEEIE